MMRRILVPFVALAATLLPAVSADAAGLAFTRPSYVDQQLAGGEPLVTEDPTRHILLYTSHEGTTHIYRQGLPALTTFTFLGSYRNQVNMWYSKDDGRSWTHVNAYAGFTQDPSQNNGFSDPDLTTDEGGRLYNTRHQPGQRRALLVQRRRRHLGPGHRAVPRRRPPVAGRGQEGRGLPRDEHRRGRARARDLPLVGRRTDVRADRHLEPGRQRQALLQPRHRAAHRADQHRRRRDRRRHGQAGRREADQPRRGQEHDVRPLAVDRARRRRWRVPRLRR